MKIINMVVGLMLMVYLTGCVSPGFATVVLGPKQSDRLSLETTSKPFEQLPIPSKPKEFKEGQQIPKITGMENFNPYQVLIISNESQYYCEVPLADEGIATVNYVFPPQVTAAFVSIENELTESSLGETRVTIFCYGKMVEGGDGKMKLKDFIGERTYDIRINGRINYIFDGNPAGELILISSCCFSKDPRYPYPVRVGKIFFQRGIFFEPVQNKQ